MTSDSIRALPRQELTEEMRESQAEAGGGWCWTRVGDGDVDRRVEVHSGGRQEEVQRANTDNADTMPFIKGESPELLCRTGTKLETAPVGKPTMKHHQTGDNNSNQQPNLATRPPTPNI